MPPIIEITNLSKQYHIGKREPYKTLRDTIVNAVKAPLRVFSKNGANEDNTIWALKDVSFEVNEGEVLGIIGRNGAGKSTLLKILSRITEPTEGEIKIRGRVGSLLEVGTGFHPELTGRENIFLNGAILGMRREEIKKKFDEIVAFAEIEKFLDTPVKRYSSGMYVRLAFAVAAHLEPEVLVVDEVLAVGDAEFQKKCLGKMGEVAKSGRTVLFVSHNMGAVQTLCTKALYLNAGMIKSYGSVKDQIEHYLSSLKTKRDINLDSEFYIGSNLQLRRFEFIPNPVESGSEQEFEIAFSSKQPTCINALTILIYSAVGTRVAVLDLRQNKTLSIDGLSSLTVRGRIKSLCLVEGIYNVGLFISCGDIHKNFLDLVNITIIGKKTQDEIAPYPPSLRGLVELEYSILA